MRARALRRSSDAGQLERAFAADNVWALAAVLWIGTGLVRAFAGFEKGTAYYLHQPLFHAKLGLVGAIILLELWPMVTLIRWRALVRRGQPVPTERASALARISVIQAFLVVVIVGLATAIARGIRL